MKPAVQILLEGHVLYEDEITCRSGCYRTELSAANSYYFPTKISKSKRTEPHTIICFIYRDAVNDLALHFLAKMKIMVVKDIEREDIEFICKGLGCKPIASLDHFTADMLGSAELAEEMHAGSSKIVKVCVNIF